MVVHAKICNIFVIYGLQNTEFLEKMKKEIQAYILQYQIKRYQAMGNGTMCQTLNGKLQKLLAKQPLVTM